MSSKRQKIEAEILKYRNEGNWTKVDEATKTLSRKYGSTDGAVMLLEAEVQLELYFQENPPRQQNVSKSRKDLAQLKVKLQDCAASDVKDTIFNVKDESKMLTCLLLYAQGNTQPCLEMLKNLEIGQFEKDDHCYKLRLLAEVNGIKGLSLEHMKLKRSSESFDSEDDIISSYEKSAEISFLYLIEYNSISNSEPPIGYGMEQAFQRGPLLYLKKGDIHTGIEKLRRVLVSKATSSIHQKIARDLACVLLRGMCDETYRAPFWTQSTSKIIVRHGSISPTATFSISPIDKPLSPTDLTQEALLLLLVSESILNADPILDMSPEYSEAREELLKDSRTLYDLLAVAVADFSLYDIFAKSVEASLKYAYNEFHLWYQYALSLICCGKFDRALRVLMECSRISPDNPAPYLLCAKIYFENFIDCNHGLDFAKKALSAITTGSGNDQNNEDHLCTAHLAVGLGHSLQCNDGTPIAKVKELRSKALLHFSEAHNVDPNDAKPLLFLAVEMALDRRIVEAIVHVKEALDLQPHDLNCLHLLALLLTAQKHNKEAFATLEVAIKFYPENINLLVTKCKLELLVGRNDDALCTCNEMASIFKSLQEACASNNLGVETMIDKMTSDGLSVTNQSIGNDLDIADAGSVIGSTAFSRVERALSDIESSFGDSMCPRSASVAASNPSILRCHIWLLTAEVYLSLHRHDDAGLCIQEAAAFFPLSHAVLFAKGRLAQCRGLLDDAVTMYENTISINPKHHKAMSEWAKILHQKGNYEFAKKLLQDAAKLNPLSHDIWLSLGGVLQELDDIEGAVECMSTAINVVATSPIVPFNSISRDL